MVIVSNYLGTGKATLLGEIIPYLVDFDTVLLRGDVPEVDPVFAASPGEIPSIGSYLVSRCKS